MKIGIIILFFIFFNFVGFAQIPRTISYQGVLTDDQGVLFPDGNNTLTLNLYLTQDGGNFIYTESQTIPVVRGVFNVIIGSVVTLPSSLQFDRAYFLGVSVNNGPELTPRTALTASPYAFRAAKADLSDDLTNGAVHRVNGLQGNVTIQGAGSTTVNQQGSTITISSTGGGGGTGIAGIQNSDGTMTVQNPNGPTATINLASDKLTSDHIKNATIQAVDIAPGVIPNVSNFIQIGSVAGGDLSNTYPNPTVAANAINSNKISDGSIQAVDIAPGVIPNVSNFIQIGSAAGGDLTGSYPNPLVGNNSINSSKIADGTIQIADLAAGIIPNNLPPSGPAGGDLTGSYPNPLIGNGKVTSSHLLNETILPVDLSKSGATHNDSYIFDVQGGVGNWVLRKPVQLTQGNGIQINPGATGPLSFTIAAIDDNPTNELQTLNYNVANKQLSISSGNMVDLSSLSNTNHWMLSGNNISNNNTGNVGIGTSAPTEKLEVNGEVLITGGNQTGFANASLRVLPTNTSDITAMYVKGTGATGNGIEAVGNTGVIGITSSSSGAGVTGISSGKSPGVTGVANTDIGVVGSGITGLSGQGTSLGVNGLGFVGVYGKSSTVGGNSRGIVAEGGSISMEAIQNTSGIGIAILGTSENGLGDGVVGVSNGTGNGVRGVNSMSTGTSGYAGLFEGRVKVTGSLNMQDRILPLTNNSIDLGSSGLRWRDVWCARNAFNGSDRRMKRNIQLLNYGLSEILNINAYSYYWSDPKMDDGNRNLGVIAQELKEIMPELVREGEEKEKLMSVNYIALIPVLINAIKELNDKVENLSKENREMRSTLDHNNLKVSNR